MVGHNCMSIKTSPRQVGRSRQLINTASQTCLYGKSGSVRPLNKQQHTAFAGGVGLGVCIMCHHRLHLMVTALFRTAQPGPAIVNTQHGFMALFWPWDTLIQWRGALVDRKARGKQRETEVGKCLKG